MWTSIEAMPAECKAQPAMRSSPETIASAPPSTSTGSSISNRMPDGWSGAAWYCERSTKRARNSSEETSAARSSAMLAQLRACSSSTSTLSGSRPSIRRYASSTRVVGMGIVGSTGASCGIGDHPSRLPFRVRTRRRPAAGSSGTPLPGAASGPIELLRYRQCTTRVNPRRQALPPQAMRPPAYREPRGGRRARGEPALRGDLEAVDVADHESRRGELDGTVRMSAVLVAHIEQHVVPIGAHRRVEALDLRRGEVRLGHPVHEDPLAPLEIGDELPFEVGEPAQRLRPHPVARHLVLVDEGPRVQEAAAILGAVLGTAVLAVHDELGVFLAGDPLEAALEAADEAFVRHVGPTQQRDGLGAEVALDHAELSAEPAAAEAREGEHHLPCVRGVHRVRRPRERGWHGRAVVPIRCRLEQVELGLVDALHQVALLREAPRRLP